MVSLSRILAALLIPIGLLALSAPVVAGKKKSTKACPQAYVALSSVSKIQGDFDPVEFLRAADLDPDKIRFDFSRIESGGFDDYPSLELRILNEEAEIGWMSAWPIGLLDSRDAPYVGWRGMGDWRTDTSGVALRGTGLGSLMYLAMAAKFFHAFPKKRLISPDHSGAANQMWESLVRKGFARKFKLSEKDEVYVYEIIKTSLGPKLKNYVKTFPLRRVRD